MKADLIAGNTSWAQTASSTIWSKAKAAITYDIDQAVYRKGIMEVLAQTFFQGSSTADQSIDRPSDDHW